MPKTPTKPASSETDPCGRYAPSPTGELHLGNLRTALLAWALAARHGRHFVLRMEDLDRERSRPAYAQAELADLVAIGITWDEPVQYQSCRGALYEREFARLQAAGLLYECYCTRRDLAEAASAPNGTPGVYPGTCRALGPKQRAAGRAKLAGIRRGPALRLRAQVRELTVRDAVAGTFTGPVDDFVIRRGDGVFSYNFVSVVDDCAAGVREVVRGADLLASTPRQVHLQQLLGYPRPDYYHVPMVFNSAGRRLAKRDGAVTLSRLRAYGWDGPSVVKLLAKSLGIVLGSGGTARELACEFAQKLTLDALRCDPWYVDVEKLEAGPALAS